MVTRTGLWIKDEVDNKKYIIKSNLIKDNYISKTIINEFDRDFNLTRVIQSDKIDISNNNWIIYNPIITKDNISEFKSGTLIIQTNFYVYLDLSTLKIIYIIINL